MKKTFLLLTLLVLGGCASIPTEFKSPCACDYRPINQSADEDGKAIA